MRTGEIVKPTTIVGMGVCSTESELMDAIFNMPLMRDRYGWQIGFGSSIALRAIRIGGGNLPLIVKDHKLTKTFFEESADEIVFEDMLEGEAESPPVEIPQGQFIFGDTISFKSGQDGVNVEVSGSTPVYKDSSVGARDYIEIRDSSSCSLSKANLPLKLGVVANSELIKIQPVVFKPVSQI